MDNTKPTEIVPALSSARVRFEIVFTEDPKNPLSLISPPLGDIKDMLDLERESFSLKEEGLQLETLRLAAQQRLLEISSKSQRFIDSATFHNRLANLHGLVGDTKAEEVASERAMLLSNLPLFARKAGEVRARRGDIAGAKEAFIKIWKADSYSALRLASFGVIEGDLQEAKVWLDEAIKINPAGYAERLFQGALHLVQNDFDSAITYFRMALDERPNSSVAYSNLGFAYLGINRQDKAFKCLKRSVALDPFNRSALVALADVGNALDKHDDVINSLRYFVEFEQRDDSVWARLAKSLFRLNLIDDCVYALKRQGSLKPSVSVWNNLGVCYAKGKDTTKSLQALKHALTLEAEGGRPQELLVARNIVALVYKTGQFEQTLSMTFPLINQDYDLSIAKDNDLSDIYSIHMNALMRINRRDEALVLAEYLLEKEGLSESLIKWIIVTETSIRGIERDDDEKLSALLDIFKVKIADLNSRDTRVLNNVAFAFAELGRFDEAMKCINLVSFAIHRDPYITATFGLINVRKGNLERGEELYKEAISISRRETDKIRIRQKMNIELGRAFAKSDSRRGRRFLIKAADEKRGEKSLSKLASKMLAELK